MRPWACCETTCSVPAGRVRHRAIVELRRATLKGMLETFSPEERAQFADYLDRFVAALDDYVRQLDGPH